MLTPSRRPPWLAGAILLALAAALVAPAAIFLGPRRWPFYLGLAALLLLLFGAAERLWKSRPARPRSRRSRRGPFRILQGGKGNGHDREAGKGDEPTWLM